MLYITHSCIHSSRHEICVAFIIFLIWNKRRKSSCNYQLVIKPYVYIELRKLIGRPIVLMFIVTWRSNKTQHFALQTEQKEVIWQLYTTHCCSVSSHRAVPLCFFFVIFLSFRMIWCKQSSSKLHIYRISYSLNKAHLPTFIA